jgi:CheY-like chemotaxis protein
MSNPTSKINILLIENDENWIDILKEDLESVFGEYVEDCIEIVDRFELAQRKLAEKNFHLITLDLELPGLQKGKFLGNDLFDVIRVEDSENSYAGLIVVTAYGTVENLKKSIGSKYRVDEFFLKEDYESENFKNAARSAVFGSLTKIARKRRDNRTILNLSINQRR